MLYTDCTSTEVNSTSEFFEYEIKQSDGESSNAELWGMQNTPLLP